MLNLPSRVEKTATPEEEFAGFDYTFGGEKIRKAASGGAGTTERLYLGGAEFVDGEAESFYHPEGRVVFDNTVRFQYKLTDHLGNTVVLFEDKNGDGEILENADPELSEVLQRHYYYPFGMQMEGLWNGQTAPEMGYLYNGKELEEDLGLNWSDYGARWYDAAIGRWNGVDPLATKRTWVSPYQFVQNDPISRVDPDGKFDTKFGAWWHKVFHGGGKIVFLGDENDKKKGVWGVVQNEGVKKTELLENGETMIHYDYDLVTSRPTKPHANSVSIGGALGGGLGLELGLVFDERGNVDIFGTFDVRLGIGGGLSLNNITISPGVNRREFKNSDFSGYDHYSEFSIGPIGYGYGEDQEIFGKGGDPLLGGDAPSGAKYTFQNVSADIKISNWKAWRDFLLKSGQFEIYRSWGQTRLFTR